MTISKRWYIVYGKRYVDMMGNYDEDILGIIEQEGISKYIEETRPAVVGHFHLKNKQYSTFIFRRTDLIKEEELKNFK